MKPKDKADQSNPDSQGSDEYKGFLSLMKALVAVPKSEIRREAEKYEKAKTERRSA